MSPLNRYALSVDCGKVSSIKSCLLYMDISSCFDSVSSVICCTQVVQSSTSPVTCSTTAVKSNFKYGYHIFGQQEATFHDVQLQGDMLVIARFYLKRQPTEEPDDLFLEPRAQEKSLYEEESLVAWAVIPLVLCANPG